MPETYTSSFNVSSQVTTSEDLVFSDDGGIMYISDSSTGITYQYTIGTVWNISTASYSGYSYNASSVVASQTAMSFKSDGLKAYFASYTANRIYQYSISVPWNISTATYDEIYIDTSLKGNNPADIIVTSGIARLFILDDVDNKLYRYRYPGVE